MARTSVPVGAARAAVGQLSREELLEKLDRKKPRRLSIPVVLDDDVLDRLEQAKQEAGMARLRADKTHPDTLTRLQLAEDNLAAAEIDYREHVAVLTFEALPRDVYELLLGKHPATAEQAAQGQDYNIDTFAPALCGMTSVDGLSAEDFQRYWTDEYADDPQAPDGRRLVRKGWNQAEVNNCWNAAVAVCTNVRQAALPKGFAATTS